MSRTMTKLPLAHVEILRSLEDIYACERVYRRLYAVCGGNNPFRSWEWLQSWLEVYGGEIDPAFICVHSENATVGIFPLYRGRFGGREERFLRFIGDQFVGSENLGPLVRPRDRQFAWIHMLRAVEKNIPDRSILFWDDAAAHDGTFSTLQAVGQKLGVLSLWKRKNVCPLLRFRPLDFYPPEVQAHYRMARRKMKALVKKFGPDLEILENETDLGRQLEDFFALHQKLWRSREKPGSFTSPRKREFYRRIASRFLRLGRLNFFTMRIGRRAVASYFGFTWGGTFYYLQSGFDPEWARYSVGTVLFYRTLQTLRTRGVQEVDFLRGAERYKFLWGARPRFSYSIYVYPSGWQRLPFFVSRWLRWKMRAVMELLV